METLSPVRVLASRLVPGSGGEGRFRGGLAIERDYEILASEALVAASRSRRAPDGALGPQGGGDGARRRDAESRTPDERPLPARLRHTPLKRGDVVRMRSAGGGGFGDPKRTPADGARDEAKGTSEQRSRRLQPRRSRP